MKKRHELLGGMRGFICEARKGDFKKDGRIMLEELSADEPTDTLDQNKYANTYYGPPKDRRER
jgi:hypothetical protein